MRSAGDLSVRPRARRITEETLSTDGVEEFAPLAARSCTAPTRYMAALPKFYVKNVILQKRAYAGLLRTRKQLTPTETGTK